LHRAHVSPLSLFCVQVVVDRLMAFLRSSSCGGDEVRLCNSSGHDDVMMGSCNTPNTVLAAPPAARATHAAATPRSTRPHHTTKQTKQQVLRRHIAGQVVELAEKYAPDTTWFLRVMAEVRGLWLRCAACCGLWCARTPGSKRSCTDMHG
jgi:hypothetical protein